MEVQEYRNQGAIGALLDEYERAMSDLLSSFGSLTPDQLASIVDPITTDEDCRSIQTILNHVIVAGYRYIQVIRNAQGEKVELASYSSCQRPEDFERELLAMFNANVQLFSDYPDIKMEEHDRNKLMEVSWGQHFDVEQLMEHAIVHILRHRRQIDRFKLKMNW